MKNLLRSIQGKVMDEIIFFLNYLTRTTKLLKLVSDYFLFINSIFTTKITCAPGHVQYTDALLLHTLSNHLLVIQKQVAPIVNEKTTYVHLSTHSNTSS